MVKISKKVRFTTSKITSSVYAFTQTSSVQKKKKKRGHQTGNYDWDRTSLIRGFYQSEI